MAGGRRPANFAAGTATRQAAADREAAAASYYSIWQQPHLQPTASPLTNARPATSPVIPPLDGQRLTPVPQYTVPVGNSHESAPWPTANNASGTLAAALDAAIALAVHRALASRGASSAPPRAGVQEDQDHALSVASSSFNQVVGSESRTSSVSGDRERERDRELASLVEVHMEAESQERKQDVQELRSAIAKLETRVTESESKYETRILVLEGRVAKAEFALSQAKQEAEKHASEAVALRELLKSAKADSRAQKRKTDSDGDRLRSRVAHLETQADAVGESLPGLENKMEFIDAEVRSCSEARLHLERAAAAAVDIAKMSSSTENVVRTSKEALEATNGLRARLKRLETSVEVSGKRIGESLALQGGAVDGLRLSVTETAASVQALKRLVEANLRSHSSAEGIVKDQAQLITRHVCVALRQFIARRISDNNILIDKALRARIPAYADAGEEFVLVREHEVDPEDDADAISSVSTGSAKRTGATVLPREVFDRVIADFDSKTELDTEKAR
jgi:hypothetical protein